jgi:hypothetical protein
MLRSTSKRVQEQVDKMRLSAVVRPCKLWRDGIEIPSFHKTNRLENLQIVMNQLPLMTARCRMTTLQLQLNSLCNSDFAGKTVTKSFAGVLEGVLGQSAGALTHLEITCNCLGSDGVSRLAKVLTVYSAHVAQSHRQLPRPRRG